jgi:AraC-like DNA-binding protein
MVIERINNWFNLSKQYFFTYSKGFFNLTYLSNSPEIMLKSWMKMPFMKHNEEIQMLHADTPFLKGEFKYAELEDGLWIFHSDMFYKNNISYKPVYDKFLPANYFFISINFIENKTSKNSYEFNNFKIENHSLSFSKPGTDFLNCHFKGSKETMYILYFSEEWADKNIMHSDTIPVIAKDLLNDNEKDFLNYGFKRENFEQLVDKLLTAFGQSAKPNIFDLKRISYDYLRLFFDSLVEEDNLNSNELSHGDRIKVQKIENYLTQILYDKFPGIDVLSEKFKISPTKLKKNFKLLYGYPIYAYFQNLKMQLALEYIEKTDKMIKEIALKFNYENVSKFSKAFQKCHDKLPSEFRR